MSSQEQELFSQLLAPHSRRNFLKRTGALSLSGAAFAAFLEACGSNTGGSTTPTTIPIGPIDMQTLISNAKKEGRLEAIGFPRNWADYGEILDSYTAKYVPVFYQAEANYTSAEELQTFEKSKKHAHGDVGDVGFKFGPTAVQEGLIVPYKHSHWDDIPADLKDPNGYWCTEYWGAQALIVNTALVKQVPTSFKDLLKPIYKNMVGIDGDPRKANDAFIAVYSAALANGGSLDNIQPGIDFFNQLKHIGNFTPVQSTLANLTKGEVAIAIMWDYLGLGYRDQNPGGIPTLKVIIPSDGSIAGPYVSIVNKTAPHPYAARLWIEHIFSDEGQLDYLRGFAHPARYQALVQAGKVPADLAARLPPPEQYANVKFVTNLNQLKTAGDTVATNWALGQ